MNKENDKVDSLKDSKRITRVTDDPHKDRYDYELQTWERNEWNRVWCRDSYKPWIYGDKKK